MKTLHAIPVGMALSMVMLAACQKPATQTAADTTAAASNVATDTTAVASNAATDTTAAAGSATANATDPGGAVSPAKSNGAINTDANKSSDNVVAASNSFTESQAKGHIENAGYTDVSGLKKSPDGLWIASAKKAGKSVNVTVDFKGAVVAN